MRINNLSELLNVQASSATKMVQKLTGLGLLDYKKYGIIFLTESGKEVGKFLLYRHHVIESFLKLIGVDENVLFETELIEHDLTADSVHKIDLLNRFLESDSDLMQRFEEFRTVTG